MIITKPKQKIFIGLTKDGTPKVQSNIPKTALVFEFESLSRADVFEVNMQLSSVSNTVNAEDVSEDAKRDRVNDFVAFAKSKIIAIHNANGHTVEDFPEDRMFFIISELYNTSIVSEDDALFLD